MRRLQDEHSCGNSIRQCAKRFGISYEAARRIIHQKNKTTQAEKNRWVEMGRSVPVKKYGFKDDGESRVRTNKRRLKDTTFSPEELDERRERARFVIATQGELMESRSHVISWNRQLAEAFASMNCPNLAKWIPLQLHWGAEGTAEPRNYCGDQIHCQETLVIALRRLSQAANRGHWDGQPIQWSPWYDYKTGKECWHPRAMEVDPDHPYLPGRKLTRLEQAVHTEWQGLNHQTPQLPPPKKDPIRDGHMSKERWAKMTPLQRALSDAWNTHAHIREAPDLEYLLMPRLEAAVAVIGGEPWPAKVGQQGPNLAPDFGGTGPSPRYRQAMAQHRGVEFRVTPNR